MPRLNSNKELNEYLLRLESVLRARGRKDLSEVVALASVHAAGMPAEFLGEARIALRTVVQHENGVFNDLERAEAKLVVTQLDAAMDGPR